MGREERGKERLGRVGEVEVEIRGVGMGKGLT